MLKQYDKYLMKNFAKEECDIYAHNYYEFKNKMVLSVVTEYTRYSIAVLEIGDKRRKNVVKRKIMEENNVTLDRVIELMELLISGQNDLKLDDLMGHIDYDTERREVRKAGEL